MIRSLYAGDISWDDTKIRPLKAIRYKCLDCVGNNMNVVKLCDDVNCPLHPFRMGKDPNRMKKILTEDEKRALVERLRNTGDKNKEG